MATSYIAPITNMDGRVGYVETGKGEMKAAHIEAGTTRPVAELGDFRSGREFATFARQMARGAGRKYEGYEVRVSWDDAELDPSSPADAEYAVQLGYEVCKRLYPNCPAYVAAHVDGDGGKLHVHCEVANHSMATGKAIRKNTSHRMVSAAVDGLMRERGLSVVNEKAKGWEAKRERETTSAFDRALGDAVASALAESRSAEQFRAELSARGVEVVEVCQKRKNPDTGKREAVTDEDGMPMVSGWRYTMRDPETGRVRRRKASGLAREFARDEVLATFAERERLDAVKRAAEAASVIGLPMQEETPEAFVLDRAEARLDLIALSDAAHDRRKETGEPDVAPTLIDREIRKVLDGDTGLFDRVEAAARGSMPEGSGGGRDARRSALTGAIENMQNFVVRLLLMMWRARLALEHRRMSEQQRSRAAREAVELDAMRRETDRLRESIGERDQTVRDRQLELSRSPRTPNL